MKYSIYKCDECGNVLSDPSENIAKKHISIEIRTAAWYEKGKGLNAAIWIPKKQISGIFQFCDGKCIAKKFKELYVDLTNSLTIR